jgi:hypothetical protein
MLIWSAAPLPRLALVGRANLHMVILPNKSRVAFFFYVDPLQLHT